MSIEWLSLILVACFALFLITGLPLAFVTGSSAVILTLIMWDPDSLLLVVIRVWNLMMSYAFVAVPMFIFMAIMLERSGVIDELFNAVHLWTGPIRGGLAVATVFACTIMAAMTGIIGAAVVTMGLIALPAMRKRGYNKSLALGTICAGGSLGTLIPPSVPFIVYGLAAEASVGQLFMAGVFPGFLLASLFIAYIGLRTLVNPALCPALPKEERTVPLLVKFSRSKGLILPGILVVAVLGSIYAGIATPSEAAGVGAAGAILCAVIHRKFSWENFKYSSYQTANITAMMAWLFFGASALVGVYTLAGGSEFIEDLLMVVPGGRWGVIIVMQLIFILLGMVLDWLGILLITTPIFVPIVVELGFDKVWFGVLFVMNMQVSYLSPPFGPAMFYLKGVAPPDVTMDDIIRSVWPFMGLQIVGLATVMAFPQIAMWLPGKMIG